MTRKTSSAPRSGVSMRERAYLHIQRKISAGDLRPDTPLSEVVLAKELKMSRTPVREALNQLVSEGLLEQTTRGTLVVQFRRQDIIELYELREALEVYSARKAARLEIRTMDKQRWQDICDALLTLKSELEKSGRPTLDADQMHRFIAADLNFHNMLMCLARNDRILKVVNDTRLLIRIFGIQREGYDAANLKRIYEQHCAIIQAVTGHDPETAMRLLTEHIQCSLKERLEAFDEWEHEASLQKILPALDGLSHN